MTGGASFRGQPLVLLGGVLLAWIGLRIAIWQPPLDPPSLARPIMVAEAPEKKSRVAAGQSRWVENESFASLPAVPRPLEPILAAPLAPVWPELVAPAPETDFPPPREPQRTVPARAVIGHNLLLAAGLSQMELPAALLAYLQAPATVTPGIPTAAPSLAAAAQTLTSTASRWSGDSWLLLRRDTTTPILSGRPSYGRSQAGAAIRYRLAPDSALRPQAYVRVSKALAGPREQELAAGLSARPLARVPVRLAAEARVTETAAGTEVRPAAYAVTELAPVRLPLGASGEAYAQAGYAGGRFATAFVDGQARVERPVARVGGTQLRAGAGAWGGAQKGSARLDIGPSATLAFRLGDAYGRVAADYRFRVAGEAEPSSGPALTVSAGF